MPLQRKKIEYVKPLGEKTRRRLKLVMEGQRVIEYVVRLEVEVSADEWRPCIRYDNEHGFPHQDQLKKNGEEKKKFIRPTGRSIVIASWKGSGP